MLMNCKQLGDARLSTSSMASWSIGQEVSRSLGGSRRQLHDEAPCLQLSVLLVTCLGNITGIQRYIKGVSIHFNGI